MIDQMRRARVAMKESSEPLKNNSPIRGIHYKKQKILIGYSAKNRCYSLNHHMPTTTTIIREYPTIQWTIFGDSIYEMYT